MATTQRATIAVASTRTSVRVDSTTTGVADVSYLIKLGDTEPTFSATLRLAGQAYDLTNAVSVDFRYRLTTESGATSKTATIVDAATGQVEYSFQAGDLPTAGAYVGEFRVTLSGGGRITFPNDAPYPFTVSEAL